MRILQVNNVHWFNATSWYALNLSRLLADAGHEVLVLGQAGSDSERKARDMGLEVRSLPLGSVNPVVWPGLLADLHGLLRDFRPQVVNCHRGEGFVLFGLLKALGHGFGLVRTRGDQRLPKANWPNRWLHTRMADAVIATNSAMAGHLRTLLGVPDSRLHVIRGGVDTTRFAFDPQGRARVRQEFGLTDEHCALGIVGRLDPVKGHLPLLQALALARRDLPPDQGERLRLLCLGFPESISEAQLRGWAADLGLGDCLVYTGRRQDVPACLSAMDIGVAPSVGSEAIARAVLELMACGRPVVGSSVGVQPDLLGDEARFPVGDVDAMARVLRRAVLEPGFREALLRRQAPVLAECTLEAFGRKTVAVYEGLGR